MKPYKRVFLTGAILTALTFTSSALAQNAGVSATSATPVVDARLEAKAAAEAAREEAKAKKEAVREEAKRKLKLLEKKQKLKKKS